MNLYRLIGFVAVGGICLCSCNLKATQAPGGVTLQNFKLFNTSISGWSENMNPSDSFYIYNNQGLEGLLDGGAEIYINGGSIETLVQDMGGPNSEQVIDYVVQFNDSAQAATVYSEWLTSTTPIDSIPGFSKNVAFGTYALSGNVYAHLGKYMFWMETNGFQNQTLAFQTASQFLGLFENIYNTPQ
ncbi:MAG: hypothetical protein ABSE00_07050 [Chitinispirillaceae bacterium]|jgi:hypothetical protein